MHIICSIYYSAFDLEREREWRQRENALKVQIAQLEATLKADLGEKGGILDKLAIEKGIMSYKQRTLAAIVLYKDKFTTFLTSRKVVHIP